MGIHRTIRHLRNDISRYTNHTGEFIGIKSSIRNAKLLPQRTHGSDPRFTAIFHSADQYHSVHFIRSIGRFVFRIQGIESNRFEGILGEEGHGEAENCRHTGNDRCEILRGGETNVRKLSRSRTKEIEINKKSKFQRTQHRISLHHHDNKLDFRDNFVLRSFVGRVAGFV